MTYESMSTEELKKIAENAKAAAAAGEARGLKDKHPLMRAAHSVLGAVSAVLATR